MHVFLQKEEEEKTFVMFVSPTLITKISKAMEEIRGNNSYFILPIPMLIHFMGHAFSKSK